MTPRFLWSALQTRDTEKYGGCPQVLRMDGSVRGRRSLLSAEEAPGSQRASGRRFPERGMCSGQCVKVLTCLASKLAFIVMRLSLRYGPQVGGLNTLRMVNFKKSSIYYRNNVSISVSICTQHLWVKRIHFFNKR